MFRVNKLIPLLPTITVATGSSPLSCFNIEASQRQSVKRQFESTAPLALSRSAPESTLCISITYIFASLSRENVTLSQTHEGGARAPHTPRHENRHAAGLTRRVTNHLTAPAATFQPPFNTLPRPQDKLCLVSRRGKELLRNRIAFPSNRILIQRGYDLWPVMLEKSNYLSGI